MIAQRDAFVVGVSCFTKLAGLDQSDTHELVRLLFMQPQNAQPVLKAAADIQLARHSEKAGDQLVKLGTAVKVAGWLGTPGTGAGQIGRRAAGAAISSSEGKNVETGTKSPVAGWLGGASIGVGRIGRAAAGTAISSSRGKNVGAGAAAGAATDAKSPAEQWQAYTASQAAPVESPAEIFRRKHPTFPGDYETVKDLPAVQQLIEAEQQRASSMTPGQIHLETLGQTMPEHLKKYITPEQFRAFAERSRGIRETRRTLKKGFRGLDVNYHGIDPAKMDISKLHPTERPIFAEQARLAAEQRTRQEALGGQRAGWAHVGGGLSAGAGGIKTTQQPIGGAGGQASTTGKRYTGLSPEPMPSTGQVASRGSAASPTAISPPPEVESLWSSAAPTAAPSPSAAAPAAPLATGQVESIWPSASPTAPSPLPGAPSSVASRPARSTKAPGIYTGPDFTQKWKG